MQSENDKIFADYNLHAEFVGAPQRVDPTLAFRAPELRDALLESTTAEEFLAVIRRAEAT